MKLSFAIVVSLIAAASASTIATTTASTMKIIMNDLTKIGHQFKKIDDTVNEFPATGLKGANELHAHGVKIHDLFESLMTNINNLPRPVSAANANKIIQTFQTFTPTDVHSINGIAAKHADFVALSVAPTVQSDLIGNANSCAHLQAILQPITPVGLYQPLLQKKRTRRNDVRYGTKQRQINKTNGTEMKQVARVYTYEIREFRGRGETMGQLVMEKAKPIIVKPRIDDDKTVMILTKSRCVDDEFADTGDVTSGDKGGVGGSEDKLGVEAVVTCDDPN
ncbi:hypothetical protein GALMADRAFT_216030 [Galerina marginata CBS 339.88]|uniref:Uncharacterized protein n=1 Tax=Galerina marginata (strain CBS 339.88) TaxID=685588 RepID=A0A067SB26_GALM3|nr:hypothetical protein GALMADRAFT_216030 [Galerina marginata CBS 339.88]